MFARYDSRETRVMYLNGAWYVVRRDLYPHTSGRPWVTRQGCSMQVGIRQGDSAEHGFRHQRFERPDWT